VCNLAGTASHVTSNTLDQRCAGLAVQFTENYPNSVRRRQALGGEWYRKHRHNQLSLSRLNHRLPRAQAHPEVVEGAAEFHHEITDASLPQADAVFDNTAALDTTVHMLDPQPPLVEYLVGPLLLQGQLLTAWLLRRHQDLDLRECERQEAQILQQPTPGREWVGSG
jgi:hypothetical protein